MQSAFASPGDEYLRRIGELAYAVSSLEWLMLGDLPHLDVADHVSTVDLVGLTTGAIGKKLVDAAPKVSDPAVADFLRAGGDALIAVAKQRNSVLHARPATVDGGQRLFRWTRKPAEMFPITDQWLDDALGRIATLTREVHALRPPIAAGP